MLRNIFGMHWMTEQTIACSISMMRGLPGRCSSSSRTHRIRRYAQPASATEQAEATTVATDTERCELGSAGHTDLVRFADLLQARSVTVILWNWRRLRQWVLTGNAQTIQHRSGLRQRFVTLIDVLVDRDIPLTVCATVLTSVLDRTAASRSVSHDESPGTTRATNRPITALKNCQHR